MANTAQSFGVKRHDNSLSDMEQVYDKAKVAANDAADVVTDGAKQAYDFIDKYVSERPYTVALGALVVGWLIGRFR
jgi:ElaB/YqjD/DUF883 family membrane-anchored ribosome-binding protein